MPTSRRTLLTGVVACGAVVLLAVASICFGARTIAPQHALELLAHGDGSPDSAVVHELRLPRTVLALVVGAALGMSGALLQHLTRNPLGDPAVLGVEAGAALAVVAGIALGARGFATYAPLALLGAGAMTLGVYALAARGRGSSPAVLALAGTAATAAAAAATTAILLQDAETLERARRWQVGSLAGAPSGQVVALAPLVLAGAVLAAVVARGLDRAALGEAVATGLGESVARTRLLTIVASALLAGACTAAVGPVGFVGLVVPHAARRLFGRSTGRVLLWSAVLGAGLLLAADLLGRLVLRPEELQVGIVTALLGGPFLLLLARRRQVAL